MKIINSALGSVSFAIGGSFYKFNHEILGLTVIIIGVLLFFSVIYLHVKEPEQKEISRGMWSKAYGLDDETTLVIKSIGASKTEFIDFNTILNDTNLSLKVANKALDWLFLSKLISDNKGRRGKVYKLEPEGEDVLDSILITEEHNKKNQKKD